MTDLLELNLDDTTPQRSQVVHPRERPYTPLPKVKSKPDIVYKTPTEFVTVSFRDKSTGEIHQFRMKNTAYEIDGGKSNKEAV